MRELLVEPHIKVWIRRTLRLLDEYLNQVLGIAHRQGTQQESIHKRKNKGSRRDADSY
jgi:hypothetical protein